MALDWQELMTLAGGGLVTVERVRIREKEVVVEGSFDLPALARLKPEDQVFVTAFVRSHGSIKEMERIFGISYPTVKNRLNHIAGQLEFVEVTPGFSVSEILARVDRGELSVEEALKRIRTGSKGEETDEK